jgi:C-terminal processing protease CtpA/Prc
MSQRRLLLVTNVQALLEISTLVVFVFLSSLVASQQSSRTALTAESRISSADLEFDLAILRRAYQELHPGLYRYHSKAEIDALFTNLQRKFQRDLSLADTYLALSTFAAQIRCGHTYPNFFNQSRPVAEALFHGTNRVPFYFKWIDGRMVVLADFTPDHQLPKGTEILRINGIQTPEVLRRLLTVARADGSNDAKRIASLEVAGLQKYEAFDIYFPLPFPHRSQRIHLTIRRPKASARTEVVVAPLSYEQRLEHLATVATSNHEHAFEWRHLSNRAAYLRVPTWALYNSDWDWKSWLDEKLDEASAKRAPALVIDIRGNEGGLDVGNTIISHLIHSDVQISSYSRFVRYRKVPDDLTPYLDTWDPSFKDWGSAAQELPKPWTTAPPVRYFSLIRKDDEMGGTVRPSSKRFDGRVYVLIDANNSSATFQFAKFVQDHKLAVLVGQPTGGNLRGINGGAFFFLRLPKSQIEMDLPLIAYFPSTAQPDAGVSPDIRVSTSEEDFVEDRDPSLATIDQLLKQANASGESH